MNRIKTRAKKFYDDHEKTINAFSAGFTLAAIIGMRAVSNTKDGMQLADAYVIADADENERLYVTSKNGKTVSAAWKTNK